MHMVECPHCRRKFKLTSAVANKRMKCSRCGEEFIGSSVAMPETPAGPPGASAAGRSVFHSDFEPAPARHRVSSMGVILLVGGFFGLAGIIVMAVLTYHRMTHPRVIVKNVETGSIEEDRTMRMEEARRQAQEIKTAEAERREAMKGVTPAPPGPGQAVPAENAESPAVAPAPVQGDEKLEVSQAIVAGGPVGEITYVCGRILSGYQVPLQTVTVTVYVDGARGPSQTYEYVPPAGSMRYSVSLGGKVPEGTDIKVAATCQQAGRRTVVWPISSDEILRSHAGGKTIYSGRTRNTAAVPVQNVKIYCDFFLGDGIQAGSAVGELVERDKLGIGKSESFRIVSEDPRTETAEVLVARAVGQTY